MIHIRSITRTPKPRKKADTRALQLIRQNMHAALYEEVFANCVEEAMERQQSHFEASQHFRQHGEPLN